MKIVKVEKEAWDSFLELLGDLENEKLTSMNRFPEPVGELRYRDLLKKAFIETGRCLAIIWLYFNSSLKKTFSFLIEADLKEGELKDILSLPGKVKSVVVEEFKDERIMKIYNESRFMNGNEIIKYLEIVGDKYRDRELYVTLKNALKEEFA